MIKRYNPELGENPSVVNMSEAADGKYIVLEEVLELINAELQRSLAVNITSNIGRTKSLIDILESILYQSPRPDQSNHKPTITPIE